MAKRELTEYQKAFLQHLLGDAKGNFQLAKKMAGYSDTVSVSEIIKSLREELREAAQDALYMSSIEASFALGNVLSEPASNGAGNKLKAAQQILDRVGVKQENEAVKIPEGGLFIMPAKNAKALGVVEDKEDEDAEE